MALEFKKKETRNKIKQGDKLWNHFFCILVISTTHIIVIIIIIILYSDDQHFFFIFLSSINTRMVNALPTSKLTNGCLYKDGSNCLPYCSGLCVRYWKYYPLVLSIQFDQLRTTTSYFNLFIICCAGVPTPDAENSCITACREKCVQSLTPECFLRCSKRCPPSGSGDVFFYFTLCFYFVYVYCRFISNPETYMSVIIHCRS